MRLFGALGGEGLGIPFLAVAREAIRAFMEPKLFRFNRRLIKNLTNSEQFVISSTNVLGTQKCLLNIQIVL